jgi:hypothetical protein
LPVPDVTVAHSATGQIAVQVGELGTHEVKAFGLGKVLREFSGVEANIAQVGALATVPKCDSYAYSQNGYRWLSTYQWRFRPTPFGGQAAMSAGIQAMANGTGGCGANLQNGAVASYLGTTGTNSSVGSNNTCGAGDYVNVVDSGALPSPTLAATCTYKTATEIFAADVKFSTAYNWYSGTSTTACPSGYYDVQGVMAHEAGHVFGLNHVAQASAQVMKPNSSTCETSQRLLGNGDLAGMKYLYP